MDLKNQRRGWSIQEVCAIYGWSRSYFYRLEKQGKAPKSLKIGRRRLILESALKEWESLLT